MNLLKHMGLIKERHLYDAMREYYSKIKDYTFFAEEPISDIPDSILREYMKGNYLIKKKNKDNFNALTQKYNTEVPEIVKEYYSYCHPFIAGQHKNNPHKTESLFLYSAVNPNLVDALSKDIGYWVEYNTINIEEYFPIGWVGYNESSIVLERKTGHILVEYGFAENPADDKEGELWPLPLADSLYSFIRELEPYWF